MDGEDGEGNTYGHWVARDARELAFSSSTVR